MKIKLLRDSRIVHKAGEVVNASPAEASFLISVGSAIEVRTENAIETPEKAMPRKRGTKEK